MHSSKINKKALFTLPKMFPGPLTSDCVEEVKSPCLRSSVQIGKYAENKSAATSPQLYKHGLTISEILSQVHLAVCDLQSEGHCSSRTERTWALVCVICV